MTMRNYSADELLELSRWEPTNDVALGLSGEITGVVIPRDYAAGQLVNTGHARTLAAQLLREADLHDAIYDSGYQAGQDSVAPRVERLRYVLEETLKYIEKPEGEALFRRTDILNLIQEAIGKPVQPVE